MSEIEEMTRKLPVVRRDDDTLYIADSVMGVTGEFTKRVERKITVEGVYERVVYETEWQELERTACFCCTCFGSTDGFNNTDPYCRNHGWAGERPCEKHGTKGAARDDGEMPLSVQQYRAQSKGEMRD